MANNDFNLWMNDSVSITNAQNTNISVQFGQLYPILLENPDVMEETDRYTFQSANDFVISYSTNYYNKGYGDFKPNL